jgi:alkanesulfonate monooxygenase SsuD/methylene tetrahydromethanopterin reductase-like flavin-dependent oxidoreductase (luciferase family)
MQLLWTEEQASYSGEFVSFPPTYCSPKPVQPGGIPLWVGGHTEATYERVARYGAGLAPGGVTPGRAGELLENIRRKAEKLGRDPESIGIVVMAGGTDRDALRRLLAEHRDAGVTEVIIPAQGRTPAELRDVVLALPELLD